MSRLAASGGEFSFYSGELKKAGSLYVYHTYFEPNLTKTKNIF